MNTAFRLRLLGTAGLVLLLAGTPAPAAPAAPTAPAPSGRITYKFSVAALSGTSIVSWINGGKQFRQEMKLSGSSGGQGAPVTSIETWVLSDGKNVYMHQPMMGKRVAKMNVPKPGEAPQKLPPSPAGPNTPMLGLGKGAGKVVGKGTILGKPCEIRKVGNAKVWTWKGLALKMEMVGEGQVPTMSMVATRLETPIKLSPDLFKVPAGYEVTDNPMFGVPGAGGTPTVRKGTQ